MERLENYVGNAVDLGKDFVNYVGKKVKPLVVALVFGGAGSMALGGCDMLSPLSHLHSAIEGVAGFDGSSPDVSIIYPHDNVNYVFFPTQVRFIYDAEAGAECNIISNGEATGYSHQNCLGLDPDTADHFAGHPLRKMPIKSVDGPNELEVRVRNPDGSEDVSKTLYEVTN